MRGQRNPPPQRRHNQNAAAPRFEMMDDSQRSSVSSSGAFDADFEDERLIYSAPTVDTLGDESSVIRPFARPQKQVQNQSQQRQKALRYQQMQKDEKNTSKEGNQKIAPPSATFTGPRSSVYRKSGGNMLSITKSTSSSSSYVNTRRRNVSSLAKKARKRRPNAFSEYQSMEDEMCVTVKSISVAERTAFHLNRPPSLTEWADICKRHSSRKKLSPSMQQLQLIHRLQAVSHVRQLCFSPSVGPASDVLYDANEWERDEISSDDSLSPSKRRRRRRDGRYRPIDPVKATIETLPSVPPLLSNKKHRLPLRSDVGFPNASPEEIQRKQAEIAHETEWEEASPRLVVLVTSDDLGTAIQDESNANPSEAALLRRWNGGGLDGMPFAGPELQSAKLQNRKHFSREPRERLNVSDERALARRTSMLAPPLDATYSRTLGWRPRPFHDRDSDMNYLLCCPSRVEFAAESTTPLLCSLALYRLSRSRDDTRLSGKISEEFWFPAGDWSGRIEIDELRIRGGDLHSDLEHSWLGRKHKGVFSYPSSVIDDVGDLCVVLQVFKSPHTGADDDNQSDFTKNGTKNNSNGNKGKRGLKKKIQSKFKKQQDREDLLFDPDLSSHNASFRMAAATDGFGTQFMAPFCYGVTRIFPPNNHRDVHQWPNGHNSNLEMHPFPKRALSQEEFNSFLIDALAKSSERLTFPRDSSPESSISQLHSSLSVTSSSTAEYSSPSGRKKGMRRFISPLKASKKDVHSPLFTGKKVLDPSSLRKDENNTILATVKIFSSHLCADFLQPMLSNPPEFFGVSALDQGSTGLKRMFVDVSGDFAIALSSEDGPISIVPGTAKPKKRSDLVRMPAPPRPAGYISAAEFREVLFLPLRADNGIVDAPPPFRTLLNLLYLHPKLLKFVNDVRNTKTTSQYTVRVRLVQRSITTDQTTGQVEAIDTCLRSFHNAASWTGTQTLGAVYTRAVKEDKETGSLKSGIPLRDEFKLRLPMVLDGSHFLQFELYTMDLPDDSTDDIISKEEDELGMQFQPIAEATIPLSNLSLFDLPSGGSVKASTVIPNGRHRIKLGDFQLQIETRLVSSVHMTDVPTAAALRDFPIVNHAEPNGTGFSMVPKQSTISRQGSTDLAMKSATYPLLFSVASGSTLLGQFSLLLSMHLSNLVSTGASDDRFFVDNFQSIVQIMRQIKLCLVRNRGDFDGRRKFRVLVKQCVDSFDEGTFHPTAQRGATEPDETSEAANMEVSRSSYSVAQSESIEDEDFDDGFDGGAIRRRRKDPIRSAVDLKISRTYSALDSTGIPFSRVAYGANEADKMRLESELGTGSDRFANLMDDDETVITAATGFHSTMGSRIGSPREIFANKTPSSFPLGQLSDENTEYEVTTTNSVVQPLQENQLANKEKKTTFSKSVSEMGLARRVRTAAQVMLAPCVAPTLSTVLTANPDSPLKHISHNGSHDGTEISVGVNRSPIRGLNAPDDTEISGDVNGAEKFRPPYGCPTLDLCIPLSMDRERRISNTLPHMRLFYVYESIIPLWIQAWREYCSAGRLKHFVRPELSRTWSTNGSGPMFDANLAFGEGPFLASFQLNLLLSLSLKSIVLRFDESTRGTSPKATKIIFDNLHMDMFEQFFDVLAWSIMDQGLTENDGLLSALESTDVILDFIVGLCSILHPAQCQNLIEGFFKTICESETDIAMEVTSDISSFEWSDEMVHRVKCSRQIRIRAIERLAVLPNFIGLNYPGTELNPRKHTRYEKPTWNSQYKERVNVNSNTVGDSEATTLPPSGWLARLLANDGLIICAHSCEAVVAEAMARIEKAHDGDEALDASSQQRPAQLSRSQLLMFQSTAIHSISCVYELLLRRHAMDRRFQNDKSRGQIAALFLHPVFERSLASVRWLARMEATHKVRSLWLLCFVYILQEAPETMVRDAVAKFSATDDLRIHRFIRLLRLSSSTFQSFIDQENHSMFPSDVDTAISPWLLQESFNTICATTIIVVEECVTPTSSLPREQKKMIQGILELLLHILTTPQSCVTHLRAVGGAIQALDKFGTLMFLEATGSTLQHWARVILSLMNNTALSVRSIAVDFVVSVLGSIYDMRGNIDEVCLIFISVLPEVVAREIALCKVSTGVLSFGDVERSLWPLRRSFADIEDANPLDDDRIDPQLSPNLAVFCRACQATIDGVIIEMRLHGDKCKIPGKKLEATSNDANAFDADEESIFEAANYFTPEIAPLQRIRWLLTLRSLHESKGQWVEAAEALMMCAKTISDSMPHLDDVWRPGHFVLWSDPRRSLWLSTIGAGVHADEGNAQVVEFASSFLEPRGLLGNDIDLSATGRLPRPTIPTMCSILSGITKDAVSLYLKEGGMDELAYTRLESLIKLFNGVLDDYDLINPKQWRRQNESLSARMKRAEDEAALRRVIASVNSHMTRLAERLLLIVQDRPTSPTKNKDDKLSTAGFEKHLYYVRVTLSGQKPARFKESTTIPTFLEWENPCVCRVPKKVVESSLSKISGNFSRLEEILCTDFGQSLRKAIMSVDDIDQVFLRVEGCATENLESIKGGNSVVIGVSLAHMHAADVIRASKNAHVPRRESKQFYYSKGKVEAGLADQEHKVTVDLVELTVAHSFPCALSRQRTLLTKELVAMQ